MAGASSTGTVTCASSLSKEVYNPKAVIPHAASLHQAFAHCARFPTAASRRSLGRVSVPVWPVALSGRLPVVALVGHYPTNKLIGREPISSRKTFHHQTCTQWSYPVLAPVSEGYPRAQGRLLTCYSPVRRSIHPRRSAVARLACVKHAASVRPEPGSNSPTKNYLSDEYIVPASKDANPLDGGLTRLALAYPPNTLLSSQRTTTHQQPRSYSDRGHWGCRSSLACLVRPVKSGSPDSSEIYPGRRLLHRCCQRRRFEGLPQTGRSSSRDPDCDRGRPARLLPVHPA